MYIYIYLYLFVFIYLFIYVYCSTILNFEYVVTISDMCLLLLEYDKVLDNTDALHGDKALIKHAITKNGPHGASAKSTDSLDMHAVWASCPRRAMIHPYPRQSSYFSAGKSQKYNATVTHARKLRGPRRAAERTACRASFSSVYGDTFLLVVCFDPFVEGRRITANIDLNANVWGKKIKNTLRKTMHNTLLLIKKCCSKIVHW